VRWGAHVLWILSEQYSVHRDQGISSVFLAAHHMLLLPARELV
jgi:hypothetical protein